MKDKFSLRGSASGWSSETWVDQQRAVLCRVYLFNGVVKIYEQGSEALVN